MLCFVIFSTELHLKLILLLLTKIQKHANKDNEAKKIVEHRHKVDNGNDNVGNGWEDLENNIAAAETIKNVVKVISCKTRSIRMVYDYLLLSF